MDVVVTRAISSRPAPSELTPIHHKAK